jgi:hypothetical protein
MHCWRTRREGPTLHSGLFPLHLNEELDEITPNKTLTLTQKIVDIWSKPHDQSKTASFKKSAKSRSLMQPHHQGAPPAAL